MTHDLIWVCSNTEVWVCVRLPEVKTREKFKSPALKVVMIAYERWSLMKGF